MAATTVLLLLFALLRVAVSRPNGAPLGACDTLVPAVGPHGPAQTSPIPYSIDVDGIESSNGIYYYTPGQTYTVTLSGNANEMFQGFLVQSRAVADNSLLPQVAVMNGDSDVKLSACTPSNSGVTHTSASNKEMIQFEWTPTDGSGAIQFRFTVVQVQRTHWDNAASMIFYPRICSGSVDIQDWTVSWNLDGMNVAFSVSRETEDNQYVALGISNNAIMPDTDIYVGANNGAGMSFVSDRYASARAPPVVDTIQNVMNTATTRENGRLTVSFTRALDTGDNEQDVSLTTTDTNCTWFLVARGPVTDFNAGTIGYHGMGPENRAVSNGRVCLCRDSPIPTPTSTPSGAGLQATALSVGLLVVLALLQYLI